MRRKYIVAPKFQWTVVIYTFVVSLITSLAHVTFANLRTISEIQNESGMETMWLPPAAVKWGLLAILYTSLFAFALIFSNRLAGPLFRLRRYMNAAAGGEPAQKITFRDKDYHTELSEAYNGLVDSLPPERKARTDQKGFSLVELLVVVSIISVVSATGFAFFAAGPTENLRFKQEAVSLRDALLSARNAAVSKNQCAFVTVQDPQTVNVMTYPIPSPCTATPLPPPDMTLTYSFRAANTVSNFSIGPTLVFRPNGGTTQQAPVTIAITSAATGRRSQLTIYPAIGQVRQQL